MLNHHRLSLACISLTTEICAAAFADFLFAVEGAAQGGIGANWGDGFATDPALIRATGISDPNPFFKQLIRKSYRSAMRRPQLYSLQAVFPA